MTLRVRLLLVLVGVLAAGLVVSDVVTFTELRGYLVAQVDQQLEATNLNAVARALDYCTTYQASDDVCDGLGEAPGAADALPANDYAELAVGSQLVYGAWLAVTDTPPSAVPQFPGAAPGGAFTVTSSTGASYRAIAVPVSGSLPNEVLYLAQPLSGVQHDAGRLLAVEVLVTVAALLGLGALSWWLVRRELHPLRQMATTAGAIASGDLSRRVDRADRHTEVGQLGLALNTMLAEIETAFAARAASEEQLRRFLADASHELRTPLTSIRGYAEMFDRGARDHPEDLALILHRIQAEADRMAVLVEDLLLLARLGQRRPLTWEPVDLAAVAEEAVVAARAADPGRSVTLRAPAPVVLQGDPGRLRQVVDNLVRNALAYSPPGSGVDVTVSARVGGPSDPAGPVAEVSVADRGPGIPAEDRARIFQPFERLDPSRTRATGGLGLGLAIVAAIVRAHGGGVWVEERPGGGSVFRVQLLVHPAQTPAAWGAPLPSSPDPAVTAEEPSEAVGLPAGEATGPTRAAAVRPAAEDEAAPARAEAAAPTRGDEDAASGGDEDAATRGGTPVPTRGDGAAATQTPVGTANG